MMVDQHTSSVGSTYVPIDNWIYPALDRLQALGYIDFAYLGLRPWTRASIVHMLDQTERAIDSTPRDEEAREIYLAVRKEVDPGTHHLADLLHPLNNVESAYTRLGRIAGTPLNDGFHLGQTIVNDYGVLTRRVSILSAASVHEAKRDAFPFISEANISMLRELLDTHHH
jgi:hypothetical protein